MKKQRVIVISVGGSLLAPSQIDLKFISDLKDLLVSYTHQGIYFIVVTGGGSVCRQYQKAAMDLGVDDQKQLDYIGIDLTRLNARLVRYAFKEAAAPYVLTDPSRHPLLEYPITVAAGWKPGHSTDYDTVIMGIHHHSQEIINLSNTDYIYNNDPKSHPNAKPLLNLSWDQYNEIIGSEWQPGMHAPFDPLASKLAAKKDLAVLFMNGHHLDRLDSYLTSGKVEGSLIK